MNDDIVYQDEYVTKRKGCSGYFFNEKCKNCGGEMDELHEHYGFSSWSAWHLYWCPKCGTVLSWTDSSKVHEEDWKIPEQGEE